MIHKEHTKEGKLSRNLLLHLRRDSDSDWVYELVERQLYDLEVTLPYIHTLGFSLPDVGKIVANRSTGMAFLMGYSPDAMDCDDKPTKTKQDDYSILRSFHRRGMSLSSLEEYLE